MTTGLPKAAREFLEDAVYVEIDRRECLVDPLPSWPTSLTEEYVQGKLAMEVNCRVWPRGNDGDAGEFRLVFDRPYWDRVASREGTGLDVVDAFTHDGRARP